MDLVNALYAQVPETKSQAERMIGWFFSAFFSFVVSSLRACICHYLSIYVIYIYILWGFPEMVVYIPQNGWCRMENPIKMDDLGVPPFQETSIYTYFFSCFV